MANYCFTGNPFVDAGIAGMCAAANVSSLSELDEDAVARAVETLLRLMTNDAAFRKKLIDKKEKVFATSEMSVVFPNGPLSQSSYRTDDRKRQEYKKRVLKKHDGFKDLAAGQSESSEFSRCFVDGSAAFALVGNDEFPLVDSKNKRNFHPGLQAGHAIGALTALSLEFFPLSILRTGVNSGFFWFIHTADENIAVACARMNIVAMNAAISRGEGLGFFGDWQISSRDVDAALVALIRHLMTGTKDALSRQAIKGSNFPVTAYMFSNDNRGANVAIHDLPHPLFRFFSKLRRKDDSDQFFREVMQRASFGYRKNPLHPSIAGLMLDCKPIIRRCSTKPIGEQIGSLHGGWTAHVLYTLETLKMSSTFIRNVEAVSERIVESEEAKHIILILQKEGARSLHRLTRQGIMTFDEYVQLVPPEDKNAAFTAYDYLLAATYARQVAKANSETFLSWIPDESETPKDKHPLIRLAERLGNNLVSNPDLGKKAAFGLAKSRRLQELRSTLLYSMRHGILSWNDFVQIFPPDDNHTSYLMRDYLLAFLYDALRDPELPEPDLLTDRIVGETQE